MARALGDELMERMVTKSDLDDAIQPIHARLDTMETKFDGKFEAMDAKLDAMEGKFDARFEAVDAKIDSVHRELSGRFNVLLAVMALGFTLLAGLGGYNAVAPPPCRAGRANAASAGDAARRRSRARIPGLGIALIRRCARLRK